MQRLVADIEAHEDEYLGRLLQVIRQPSIAAGGLGLTEMADLVADALTVAGFRAEQVPTDGPPVVLARLDGQRQQTLLFYNHYDVQPVDPIDEWESPPFEPLLRDGRLYGRGVADNKGAMIARLCAVETYLRLRDRLPVNLTWVIEGEEEIGSPHVHQFVAARKDLLREPFGCLWEAGGKNAREQYEMALGCKGLLYLELRTKEASQDLHSALAAGVVSPTWRLLWALNSVKGADGRIRIPGFYEDVRPPTPAQRQALAGWDYPEEEDRALYGIDAFLDGLSGEVLKEQLLFGPTFNVDGFHSGYGGPGSKTVLPCEAFAKADFRLVPDQRPERVLEGLRAHLDAEGFGDVDIAWWHGEAPVAGDPEHPFVRMAVRAAEALHGRAPAVLPLMAGTGPIHLLCDQFGVPVVTGGVGHADSRAHAPNENIRVADFFDHIRYVVTLLDHFEG
jgi:acetylornithine deacetylase/succinyl-diaminopimelate desuccinylase-like protein